MTSALTETDELTVLGGRYELGPMLGVGGGGMVHRALDRVTGATVAVKRVQIESELRVHRVRREVAALRALNIPRVVRLIDEGSEGSEHLIVMELIEGAPFPGRPTPVTWTELAEPATRLLETLARVHAAGIVHRDLKPSNVLVDEHGVPTVLDFGLARGESVGETFTRDNAVLGTPRYFSPEQFWGRRATPQSDLYAVGLVLFEALTGELPFEPSGERNARYTSRARRLDQVLPDADWVLTKTLDRLLELEPSDRFESAADVLRALAEADGARRSERPLPRLGPAELPAVLGGLIASGGRVHVTGPSGSGRTRLLRDALAQRADVLWLNPRPEPFESLAPLMGTLEGLGEMHLEAAQADVGNRLGKLLSAGEVIVADDFEAFDPWSREALEQAAPFGTIVTSGASALDTASNLTLEPLNEVDLRELFHGPDSVLHLREDGARLLRKRTSGLPANIDLEVNAWIRAGLAAWDGDRLRITRSGIESVEVGLVGRVLGAEGGEPIRLSHAQEQLLALIHLAGGHAGIAVLGALNEGPRWRVEARLQELAELGAISVDEQGLCEPLVPSRQLLRMTTDARQALHGRVADALPEGAPQRVIHRILAGTGLGLVEDTRAVCLAMSAGGLIASELSLVEAATHLAHGLGVPAAGELLAEWTIAALIDGSPEAIRTARFAIEALDPDDERQLVALLRAGEQLADGDRAEAIDTLAGLHSFADLRLETRRQVCRVRAVRSEGVESEADLLRELDEWAEQSGDSEVRGRVRGWWGLHAYRTGEYLRSAEAHLESLEGLTDRTARVAAETNAASALLEAGEPRRAVVHAARARTLAQETRHARYEARAEWLLRTAAYRAEAPLQVELELLEAAEQLGDSSALGLIELTEAAIAFRSDDMALARRLAERAHASFERIRFSAVATLCACLAVACGAPAADPKGLRAAARSSCPPDLGLQSLGLLARVSPLESDDIEWMREAADAFPVEQRGWRRDILSIDEALAACAQKRERGL